MKFTAEFGGLGHEFGQEFGHGLGQVKNSISDLGSDTDTRFFWTSDADSDTDSDKVMTSDTDMGSDSDNYRTRMSAQLWFTVK